MLNLNEEKKVEIRIEKDFLGIKEVPRSAYYGIQTLRAVKNFPITGYPIDKELIKALGMVKKAAEEVIDGKMDEQFIVDPIQGGAGTSLNMNTNEVICNRALELLGHEKGMYVHLSPNSHVICLNQQTMSFLLLFTLQLLIY